MARITIEADTTEQLVTLVKGWLNDRSSHPDAEKFERAVRRMTILSREIAGDIATAVQRGQAMTVDATFAERHGKSQPGELGGAIAGVWGAFDKEVGRPVLIHDYKRTPATYSMSPEDAEDVLAALRKLAGE